MLENKNCCGRECGKDHDEEAGGPPKGLPEYDDMDTTTQEVPKDEPSPEDLYNRLNPEIKIDDEEKRTPPTLN